MSEQEYYHHQEMMRSSGMSFKTWVQLIAGILIVGVVGTVVFLALPTIKALSGILGIVIVGSIILAIPCTLAGGAFYLYTLAGNKKIQARRFAANANNAYSVYLDEKNGRFIQAVNGALPTVVPQHYAPSIQTHNHNDIAQLMKLLQLQAPQTNVQEIAGPQVQAVSFEDVCRQVQRNSYQVCYGWDLKEQQYIVEELGGAHILLIGGTRKGKSCQAGQIIDQLGRTHDREHVLLSLLDLEDLTCNLFAQAPNVLKITLPGGRVIKSIARSHEEVVTHLGYLVQLMDYRYSLTPREREQAAKVVVYLEEFMELKRRLRARPDLLKKLSDDFTTLASRGIKAGIHLMVCAQASYSQEEFREAMGQFIGVNMSFCAAPKLAQAAGFSNYPLLKENYLSKTPGRFVVEGSLSNTIGIAPDYDVKQKLLAMQAQEEGNQASIAQHIEVSEETNSQHLLGPAPSQHPASTSGATPEAPAWGAYLQVISQLQEEGHTQDAIIEKIWNAKKGSNQKYLAGREIYRACIAHIKDVRQERIDAALAHAEAEEEGN